MTSEKLYEVLGGISEKHINEARVYHRAKRPGWIMWGAMAACLCIVISLSVIIPLVLQQDEPEQLTTGGHLEIISAELIEWQNNGFKAIVVDTGNSSIFPVGAKFTVIFREYNTEIVLDDGTGYGYGEIQIDDINWEIGSVIEVSFGVYEKYDDDREYENKVYAYRVELVPG